MDDTFLPGKEKWSRRTGYPLIMIRGAAHNANDDQPDIVNGIVLDFIKNNGYNRRTKIPWVLKHFCDQFQFVGMIGETHKSGFVYKNERGF